MRYPSGLRKTVKASENKLEELSKIDESEFEDEESLKEFRQYKNMIRRNLKSLKIDMKLLTFFKSYKSFVILNKILSTLSNILKEIPSKE